MITVTELGIAWTQGFHIWENIPKYFHESEADLKGIKWLFKYVICGNTKFSFHYFINTEL